MEPHGHYRVPITSQDQLYGVFAVFLAEEHERDPEEELFLSSVARILATTIERKQAERALHEREAQLLIAQRIQKHLLPDGPPSAPVVRPSTT
jgi:GAF domain-containing protein